MLFSTFEFLLGFLPITLAGYRVLLRLDRIVLAKLWLVAASLVFYGWWDWRYLPLLVASVAVNFQLGKVLNHQAPQRPLGLLWAGILLNLGALGYFKYVSYFVMDVPLLLRLYGDPAAVILPLAISYYTFQQVAYLVDCYRGTTREYEFINYALFILFFPQLLMGPIVHHRYLVPQFSRLKLRLSGRRNALALFFFSAGLIKKLGIADPLAGFADVLSDTRWYPNQMATVDAWLLAFTHYARFYFDLSGYADMAIGIALLFGIRIPINFNSPLRARNIAEYWRRWHITLSQFLGDHIYRPIAGNPTWRAKLQRNIVPLGILVTFLASGLWHGNNWNYVLWGLLNGAGVVAVWLLRRRGIKLPGLLAWQVTLLTLLIARVLTVTDSLVEAGTVLKSMFTLSHILTVHLWAQQNLPYVALLAGAIALAWFSPNTQQLAGKVIRRPALGVALGVASLAVLVGANASLEFTYFEF